VSLGDALADRIAHVVQHVGDVLQHDCGRDNALEFDRANAEDRNTCSVTVDGTERGSPGRVGFESCAVFCDAVNVNRIG
jgi:hypothetical protein